MAPTKAYLNGLLPWVIGRLKHCKRFLPSIELKGINWSGLLLVKTLFLGGGGNEFF